MDTTAFITPTERMLLLEYDRQRRLGLARNIALILGLVSLIGIGFAIASLIVRILVEGYAPTGDDPVWVILVIIMVVGALFISAFATAQQGHAEGASRRVIAAVAFGALGYLFITNHDYTLGPHTLLGLLVLFAVIVIVGYLGNARTLIITTLILNAISGLTLALGIPFPVDNSSLAAAYHSPVTENTFLVMDHLTAIKIIPVIMIVQWAVTALLLAGGRSYQQTLRELGDVRLAYQRARQVEDLKDQFITMVNHELRNPVMVMQTYIELLRIKGHDLAPTKRDLLIHQASKAGKVLTKLISSILAVNRLDHDAAAFIPAVVLVHPAVIAAAALVDPDEVGKAVRELRIEVPAELVILGDEVRLQQIMTNLIANAVKYSAATTPIIVQAALVQSPPHRHIVATASQVEITVQDFGLGIPPDQQPVLFQRFVRLPRDLASTIVGNGLGLYLCKCYTEAMGGRIWCESSGIEGEGSTFHVRLPVPLPDDPTIGEAKT